MTKKRKIICIFIIAMLLLGNINISNAVVTSTDVTVESGGTVNITLTSSVVVHSFRIELVDSGGLTFVSAAKNASFTSGASNGSLINGITEGEGSRTLATYVLKAPDVTETTTYKVKFNITDMDTQDNVMGNTATVTVKPVENPKPPVENTTGGTTTEEPKNETEEHPTKNEIPEDPPVQEQPQEDPKSKNNHLSSLTVSDGVVNLSLKQTRTGSTGFNRDVEDYTVIFPESYDFDNLEVLKVSASKEDNKATISGAGNYSINEGDNNLEVKCTAEDGSVRTYIIRVTKPIVINKSELKLDSLSITQLNEDGEKEPIVLDKLFNAETYEYESDLEDDVESVFVKLTAPKVKDKDIIVKVNGKEISRDAEGNLTEEEIKLNNGKNTIRITLVSPLDETVTTDYVVTINKEVTALASVNETNGKLNSNISKNPIVIIGIILGIILLLGIVLIVLLIINHRKNMEESEPEYVEELESKIPKTQNEEEKAPYLDDSKLENLNKNYSSKIEDEIDKANLEDSNYLNMENKDELLEELAKSKEETIEENKENANEEKLFSKDEYLRDIKNKKGRHF